jgi:two-component system, OmpR family, response regulator
MKRVLLVEDNPDVRTLLVEILKDARYEVADTWSFQEAKRRLSEEAFDLLVANVLLPGGGHGTELAAIARSKGMKCLLVTGHPGQLQMLVGQEHPYIAKPFPASEFIERVKRICEGD